MPLHQERIGIELIHAPYDRGFDQLKLYVVADLHFAAKIEIRSHFERLVDRT